jgi:uncharacterized membrane protein YedE/YeeE
MPKLLIALLAGLLFGLGLTVSQMIDPQKVLGFLDLYGDWDPSLAFVMAGAIPVAALGFWLAGPRAAPFCAADFARPSQVGIDRRLASGAVLFGIGWGLVGYCPGPAVASLGFGNPGTWLFVAAMLVGMLGFARLQARSERRLRRA